MKSLLNYVFWTLRPKHQSHSLRTTSAYEANKMRLRRDVFIIPEAPVCWRLNTHGWSGKLQGQALCLYPELVAITAALLGHMEKAACKILFKIHPTIKWISLDFYLLVYLSTEYFLVGPNLFSTTLLPCDFVWWLGNDCQTFFPFVHQENDHFILILVFISHDQSLKLLCFSLQEHLTAINQNHGYSSSHQAYLDGCTGVWCEGFLFCLSTSWSRMTQYGK